MDEMKKTVLTVISIVGGAFVVLLGIIGLCFGIATITEKTEPKPYQEIVEQGDLTTVYEYNAYDRLLSKSIYNSKTKITTVYNYLYETDGWGTDLVDIQVYTIDPTGKILNSSEVDLKWTE